MTGAELRMRRLFGKESGRAYVVAIDHGMLFGVQEGSEDVILAVERLVATDPDGLFISPGLLARTGLLLAHGARIAAEIGADMIKTEYTGDPETMTRLVNGCRLRYWCSAGPGQTRWTAFSP
jgi:DhnA family fructose-bisphosphate aldolase class Ia